MGKENERDLLDEYFGPREEEAIQSEFIVLEPHGDKQLVEGTTPVVKQREKRVGKEERGGTATNITQVETIYPALLEICKITQEPIPLRERERTGFSKPAVIGEQLHIADAIFSITLHQIKGNLVDSYLPSYEESELERIKIAVEDIEISRLAGEEEIRDALMIAWGRYRNLHVPEDQREYEDSPLPGFGLPDPREKDKFIRSQEIDEYAAKLAEAWAREAVKDEPMTWEFERDPEKIINQREVSVSIKFKDPNLQVRGRFDSTSRRVKSGKVRVQSIDLKTGRRIGERELSPFEEEIRKRQSQLMFVMAERFTTRFMREFESLKPQRIYPMTTQHDSDAFEGRIALAGERYFDIETGDMWIEEIDLPPKIIVEEEDEDGKKKKREVVNEERVDFNKWLSWYGSKINLYKDEIREILSRSPDYNLAAIEVDMEKLEEEYKDN